MFSLVAQPAHEPTLGYTALMDPRITEFHCIMPIANVPSVLKHGILSYERMSKLPHSSVAMPEIQDRRDKKSVPGGLKLHQYANLYFHARNPMMFKRKDQASSLCVLRIRTSVLTINGVVFSDQNAASDYARFFAPAQWNLLPLDDIYSMDWRHSDQITYYRQKSRKCAEVLVPQTVPASSLAGAYVASALVADALNAQGFRLPTSVNPVLFFK